MILINTLAILGSRSLSIISTFGRAGYMLFRVLFNKPEFAKQWPLLVKQFYNLGVLSLLIVTVSGLFIGMVIGLEGYFVLAMFNAESALGMMVALSLLRELGPVLTALLFAGRAGSALTAEIGLMKVTEQLSSLEMMAVDPLRRVIAPCFWAGLISMPLLVLIFISVGVLGGSLIGSNWKGIDWSFFELSIYFTIDWERDILNSLIKSVVFSFIISWIALFNGYDAIPTSDGVGRATTKTVVCASLVVLALDFVLTSMMFGY